MGVRPVKTQITVHVGQACFIRDKLHTTYDVTYVPSCWMTSEFYVCNLEMLNSASKFQMLKASLFVIDIIDFLNQIKRNILVPKLFGFFEFVCLPLYGFCFHAL